MFPTLQRPLAGILALALLLCASSRASEFPVPYNSETEASQPLSPEAAAASFKLAPGFKASVVASEPEVQQPIAMAWDARGRLWIAENYTYAEAPKKFDLSLSDRILIFENVGPVAGGKPSRKVFSQQLQMLTSIEPGIGGVWAMCPPQLVFIPDKDGDDIPDGPPQVVLDGFTVPVESPHNYANGLRFGPDGWLYGRCGGTAPGDIGAPGTPAQERIPLRGGMWRYHPARKVFEAIASGTTNPWGHDWDQHGELFFINTVNGHLWHAFAGAHFMRGSTLDPNPHAYKLIDQHADHWHFDTTQGWTKSRDGAADSLGGGHAHIGAMIYQGGRWPAEYRDRLLTFNMHGFRINQEILKRRGSGYVASHGPDFLISGDKWFRGIDLSSGPDGNLYCIDWSDTGECHERSGVHRTSGRIFKIAHNGNGPAPAEEFPSDLTSLSDSALVQLLAHSNVWFARQARLQLAGRAQKGLPLETARELLFQRFKAAVEPAMKLHHLWSLHAIGALDTTFLCSLLGHGNEHLRAWALRLLSDAWPLDTPTSKRPGPEPVGPGSSQELLPLLTDLARSEPSGLVRLALASTLQRLPVGARPPLAAALLGRKEDAADHNIPLLVWYGLIPLAETDPQALAQLAARCELPVTRTLIARRVSQEIQRQPGAVDLLVETAIAGGPALRADLIAGISEGFTGWRKAPKPASWERFLSTLTGATESLLSQQARQLSVLFGDGLALEEIKRTALDSSAELQARRAALQTLIDSQPPDLKPLCEQLLSVRFLNPVAARGLALFNLPEVGAKLAGAWGKFHLSERPQLLATLVSRASFAHALLDAVEKGQIPKDAITPYHARQINSLGEAALSQKLTAVWGALRDAGENKTAAIAAYKGTLPPSVLAQADLSAGRAVFAQSCAACHTLYGEGGKLGPDLTGAGRDNLDYLLESIMDPSALVSADYRMTLLHAKDGRVLSGMVRSKTEHTVTLQTMTETLTLERSDVLRTEELPHSIMPEGLLENLPPDKARDLLAYLMHKSQVPLTSTR